MNPKMHFNCRPAQLDDLHAIHVIQEESYSVSMQEHMEVLRRRLRAAPQTCWIAVDGIGPCGYLFAYPSTLGAITPLEGDFSIPRNPDTLYLHDLAIFRRVAGQGVGNALFSLAMETAHAMGLRYSGLVSVQGSRNYWMRRGYEAYGEASSEQRALLKDYPAEAVYMVKRLSAEGA